MVSFQKSINLLSIRKSLLLFNLYMSDESFISKLESVGSKKFGN